MSHPSSVSKNKTSKELAFLATCFMLVSFWTYSLTLKLEATYSFETSVERITRHYIPKDRTLQVNLCFLNISVWMRACLFT
jgi:hypothetical protein